MSPEPSETLKEAQTPEGVWEDVTSPVPGKCLQAFGRMSLIA